MKRILSTLILMSSSLQAGNPVPHFLAQTLVEPSAEYLLQACGVKSNQEVVWSPTEALARAKKDAQNLKTLIVTGDSSGTLNAAVLMASAAAMPIAHMYAAYRMPQWVDTYVLHEAGQRTFAQNITSFLTRHGHFKLDPDFQVGVKVGYEPLSKDLILRNLIAEIMALGLKK